MTDNIFPVEICGKTRELLLPANRILDAQLSPDGFDLAVLTDEGLFLLDALSDDPPEILASALSVKMALILFGGITRFFYEDSGALTVEDDTGWQRELDTRAAMLWWTEEKDCVEGAFEAYLDDWEYTECTTLPWNCAVSDLVWKGNRPGYGIDADSWDKFAATLAERGEIAAWALLSEWKGNKAFLNRLMRRVHGDIVYAAQYGQVGFSVDKDKAYTWPTDKNGKPQPDCKTFSYRDSDGNWQEFPYNGEAPKEVVGRQLAPASYVTFRYNDYDRRRERSFFVVPHLYDGFEAMRELFRPQSPRWADGREEYIHWNEYDFSQPDVTGFADSCFRDPYGCDKPYIYHSWTLKNKEGKVNFDLATVTDDGEASDAYDTVPYGDFRLAVLYGLAGMK